MTDAISIALSGLGASLKRLDAAASNIANVRTTGSTDPAGRQAYQAQTVVQTAQTVGEGQGSGVTAQIVPKKPSVVPAFSPDSPDADTQGVVNVPNVDLAEEAVNLKLASLTYRANLKVMETAFSLSEETSRLLDSKA